MEVVFEHPFYLILLLSIPLLILTHFYFFRHIKKKAIKFANFEALKRVTGSTLITKNTSLLILRLVIITLLILSASGPVLWYKGKENYNDFVLTIDTSASMLTEDLYPDRMRAAKQAALAFVDTLDSRTQIGVVSFSGVALIEDLLSIDMNKIKQTINNLDIMTAGGTDIGTALITSTNILGQGIKSKTIILLTDGSQTTGSFVNDPVSSGINYAKKHHVIVHTIGIGTEQGISGYLPLNISAVYDKETLERIAEETGGKFFEARNEDELLEAFSEIASLKNEAFLDIDLRFGLMMISLILIFVEWGLINTKFRAVP
ncbi:VWA domain-containing protein [Candidatus Woesearchaeota archaeon]|nr:VWA domain-containing protein [Candidatus Woesearchaeota archaeon]